MGQPIGKPLTPMSDRIGVTEHRLHPDFATRTDLDGAGRHVVCPQIERAAERLGVVHGFIKKTQKTPAEDLDLARRRMKEMMA